QADVEDDGIVGLARAEIVAFLTIEGAIDHVAGVGECRRQLPIEVGVVFDHEEPHGNVLRGSGRMLPQLQEPPAQPGRITTQYQYNESIGNLVGRSGGAGIQCSPTVAPLAASTLACSTVPSRASTVSRYVSRSDWWQSRARTRSPGIFCRSARRTAASGIAFPSAIAARCSLRERQRKGSAAVAGRYAASNSTRRASNPSAAMRRALYGRR